MDNAVSPNTTDSNTNTTSNVSSLIKPLKIGIVAGEASGDALGAKLMQELNQMHPRISWVGVGGSQMHAVGMNSVFNTERLAVMGLVEVIQHLPDLLKAKEELLTFLEQADIDIYIGVDAPDFNLRIAKVLKQKNIHTIQYVSPSVWAWREKRIHKIMAATNQVLCLFPFELPVYKKYNHPAVCVGHPLLKEIQKSRDMLATRRDLVWQVEPLKKRFIDREITSLIGLLPGSRTGEINRIAPVMFESALNMLKKDPTLSFLVPVLTGKQQQILTNILKKHPEELQQSIIILVNEDNPNFSHQVMTACDMLVVASGTVSLEAMLLGKPMVVIYKLNKFSYALAKRMVKLPFVSLPNIIANKEIVPELIQDEATPATISVVAMNLLNEENAKAQISELHTATNKLRHQDVEPIAGAILAGFFN